MAGETEFLRETFAARFPAAESPRCWRAPGRVNLIGEHTDYTQGFVLPIAIDKACYTAWSPGGHSLSVFSENFGEGREWRVDEIRLARPAGHWSDYVLGVAQQLLLAGFEISPGSLLIDSTVPVGAGLSSSASLEVAVAQALLDGRAIQPLDLALLCRRAENEFVGTPCGIMDQYIAVFGRHGAGVCIDCRTLESQPVLLPEGIEMIAVNSMVKHQLGQSAYRDRVRECRDAEALLGKPLRDASVTEVDRLPEPIRRRARHVVTENSRVLNFKGSDASRLGKLLVDSHRSLQHDYEVSCAELDFLVDRALEIPGVHGARMTGGGFGGCTINLAQEEFAGLFSSAIANSYQGKFGVTPQIFFCHATAGAGPLLAED